MDYTHDIRNDNMFERPFDSLVSIDVYSATIHSNRESVNLFKSFIISSFETINLYLKLINYYLLI